MSKPNGVSGKTHTQQQLNNYANQNNPNNSAYSYYTSGPKAESPISQGPQPVFVKTLYTLSVRAQTHLSKFPETV